MWGWPLRFGLLWLNKLRCNKKELDSIKCLSIFSNALPQLFQVHFFRPNMLRRHGYWKMHLMKLKKPFWFGSTLFLTNLDGWGAGPCFWASVGVGSRIAQQVVMCKGKPFIFWGDPDPITFYWEASLWKGSKIQNICKSTLFKKLLKLCIKNIQGSGTQQTWNVIHMFLF